MNLKDILNRKSPRFYFRLLTLRSQLSLLTRAHFINDYLKSTPHPKLQLGSGRNHLEGWLNTDFLAKHPRFVYLNVSRTFPLPSNIFERIYSEHLIEHLFQADGETMLAESFRVLKPGGRIRLETPDLQKISNLYAVREKDDAREYCQWHHREFGNKNYPPTICFAINNIMRNWDHRFLYDQEMLQLVLSRAGFRDIKPYAWNETEDPEFRNISQRKGVAATEYETLVMEGTKPV
jgi:predicted SAM-dependent methyltransferase